MIQSRRLFGPLLKTGLPLMKNVIKALAKSVLIPLGLEAASAADAKIHKKIGSRTTTLIISNDEIEGIMIIVIFSKILKRVSETIQNEVKEQKGWFLSMLLCTIDASLLGNMLAFKWFISAGCGSERSSIKDFQYRLIL